MSAKLEHASGILHTPTRRHFVFKMYTYSSCAHKDMLIVNDSVSSTSGQIVYAHCVLNFKAELQLLICENQNAE